MLEFILVMHHFPEDAGWRAAAANLSDLAAMGLPLGITVGLGIPGDVPVQLGRAAVPGVGECLLQYLKHLLWEGCLPLTSTLAITASVKLIRCVPSAVGLLS